MAGLLTLARENYFDPDVRTGPIGPLHTSGWHRSTHAGTVKLSERRTANGERRTDYLEDEHDDEHEYDPFTSESSLNQYSGSVFQAVRFKS